MTPPTADERLRRELERWRAAGLERRLSPPRGADFCTNDYLGLAADPALVAAAVEALRAHGVGARAARLLGGEGPAHAAAEAAAAEWLGAERALLFPSGYQANVALLQAVAGRGDLLLSDAANHASLIDGARLSHATVQVFEHGDPGDLERRLCRAAARRARFVVVESVFSTDGDVAPLEAYAELAERHDAWLLVDEAHAAGLYGAAGEGRAAGLSRVLARTVTGGKALGVAGAFVAGSAAVVDSLLARGRAFVFTTAALPALAAALTAAIGRVRGDAALRRAPHAAAEHLRAALGARGVTVRAGSPIVFVRLGTPQAALEGAAALQAEGFDVRALRPPTVPPGSSGLRIVCHAGHAPRDLEALADAVARLRPARAKRAARPARPPALVVAGTDTGVGKTVVAALLVRAARRRGADAAYLKPVQTGDEDDTATVRRLGEPTLALAPAVHLALPASVDQAAAHAGVRVTCAQVLEAVESAWEGTPTACWVLETAGGLRVPLNEAEEQVDWLKTLRTPVVLVARSGLGTLNHTLLSVEAAERRGLELRGLVLVGEPHAANERTLRGRLPHLPLLALPPLEPLDAAALDRWLDGNDLEALWT